MLIALALHAAFIAVLYLLEPIYTKPPEIESLLPPVTEFKVTYIQLPLEKASGMDVSGSGGGEGTINRNPNAEYGEVAPSHSANPRSSVTNQASIVPRSLQGSGMNDIAGINKQPVYFDTLKGYNGTAQSGIGSGGGRGTTIGYDSGSGSGVTDKPGFGGGFGNRFVPGNPANNSATGTPYSISWNGVSRALLSGDPPAFPAGVQHGGVVKIRLSVDPAGNILTMVPVEKSDSRLEEAAMSAIRTWRFSKLPQIYPQVNQQATAKFIFKVE